jgi:hypothetical protein
MTDATLLEDAPVEVKTFLPHEWREAMDYDEIVITGTDLLTPEAMLQLAKKNPVVAIHHEQAKHAARARAVQRSQGTNLPYTQTPRARVCLDKPKGKQLGSVTPRPCRANSQTERGLCFVGLA